MFMSGSPGLRGRPNRAPNWPDQVLPSRPLNPMDSPKRAAPAHIRTFTGIHVRIQFTSDNMIIHFLHMEPSNPQTYYTHFTYILAGLHQEIHINTIIRSCSTRSLFSRTQHRLTLSCHFWRAPPTSAGFTPNNAQNSHNIPRPSHNTVY